MRVVACVPVALVRAVALAPVLVAALTRGAGLLPSWMCCTFWFDAPDVDAVEG